MQETLHDTARHSSYSGLSVLRDLGRHRGNQTLAPIVYTSALGLGDLFAGEVTDQFGAPVWTISQGPQVLIDAQATPLATGLMINWDVRVDAFRPGVADAMFAYHLAELTRLATDDAAWDAPDPPAVPEAQRAVRDAVNSATAPPSGETIHDGFFRNALAAPDAPAVFSDDGDLTYGELRTRALAVAEALRGNGVRPGDLVALIGPKCAEQIPAVLGILAAGAAYLPIGADQPADRAARILESSGVTAVLLCGGADPVEAAVPVITVADAMRRDCRRRAHPGRPARLGLRAVHLRFDRRAQGRRADPRRGDEHRRVRRPPVRTRAGRTAAWRWPRWKPTCRCWRSSRSCGPAARSSSWTKTQRRDPDTWAEPDRTHSRHVPELDARLAGHAAGGRR